MSKLPKEYRHEPELALSGGTDGLDIVQRILEDGPNFLKPKGNIAMEIGHNRLAFEKRFRLLPVTWLLTSSTSDAVCLVSAADLATCSIQKNNARKAGK